MSRKKWASCYFYCNLQNLLIRLIHFECYCIILKGKWGRRKVSAEIVQMELELESGYLTTLYSCDDCQMEYPYWSYILIQTHVPIRTLRSSDAPLLAVPRTCSLPGTELARLVFSVAAPSVWNSLPADIQLCESVPLFKRHLKTHLFRLS